MMNRRLLIVLAVILAAGLLSLLALKLYTVEIVHSVVINALMQKAPLDYDHDQIKRVFDQALGRYKAEGHTEKYLERLQKTFHNLEKRQYLERREMDRLLAEYGGKQDQPGPAGKD
jgi:hypothetical protein